MKRTYQPSVTRRKRTHGFRGAIDDRDLMRAGHGDHEPIAKHGHVPGRTKSGATRGGRAE